MTRTLALRADRLAELTPAELRGVDGGDRTGPPCGTFYWPSVLVHALCYGPTADLTAGC